MFFPVHLDTSYNTQLLTWNEDFSVIASHFYYLDTSWLFLLTHRYNKCLPKTLTSHTNSPLVLRKICPWNIIYCLSPHFIVQSSVCISPSSASCIWYHSLSFDRKYVNRNEQTPIFIHIPFREAKNNICNKYNDESSQRANISCMSFGNMKHGLEKFLNVRDWVGFPL